jgi:acyl-CoA thioesterase-1
MLLFLFSACGAPETPDPESPVPATSAAPTPPERAQTILVLGNSIAAGFGVEPNESFPARLQEMIDSTGLPFRVVNAGVSGETTAGGLSRIDWLLRQPVDVLVLELGGNDGLRGTNPEASKSNLATIVERTRARYPEADILLAGMQMPPNLGQTYTARFREIYPELARELDLHLVPFLLENVGGVSRLNQSDGIHPTPAGHRLVAATVWRHLEPILRTRLAPA